MCCKFLGNFKELELFAVTAVLYVMKTFCSSVLGEFNAETTEEDDVPWTDKPGVGRNIRTLSIHHLLSHLLYYCFDPH